MKKIIFYISIIIFILSLLFLFQFRDINRMFNSYLTTTVLSQEPYTLKKIKLILDTSKEYHCFDYKIYSKNKKLIQISCTKIGDNNKFTQLFDSKESIAVIQQDIHGPKVGAELLFFIFIVCVLFILSFLVLFYFLFKRIFKENS